MPCIHYTSYIKLHLLTSEHLHFVEVCTYSDYIVLRFAHIDITYVAVCLHDSYYIILRFADINGEILPLRSQQLQLLQLKARSGERIACSTISRDGSVIAFSDQEKLRVHKLSIVSILLMIRTFHLVCPCILYALGAGKDTLTQ